MATGTNAIALESEVKSKLGSSASVTTNLCCTKQRAIALGADSSKLSSYSSNQLVRYTDVVKYQKPSYTISYTQNFCFIFQQPLNNINEQIMYHKDGKCIEFVWDDTYSGHYEYCYQSDWERGRPSGQESWVSSSNIIGYITHNYCIDFNGAYLDTLQFDHYGAIPYYQTAGSTRYGCFTTKESLIPDNFIVDTKQWHTSNPEYAGITINKQYTSDSPNPIISFYIGHCYYQTKSTGGTVTNTYIDMSNYVIYYRLGASYPWVKYTTSFTGSNGGDYEFMVFQYQWLADYFLDLNKTYYYEDDNNNNNYDYGYY